VVSAPITLRVLGGLWAERDGAAVTGRAAQKRRLAILALLSAAPGRCLSRDKLVGYLWTDHTADQARHLLTVALYEIRRALGEDLIASRGDDVVLSAEAVRSDAEDFRDSVQNGDWTGAVSLYAGPFMDGVYVDDAPGFERWVDAERERHARMHREALEALASACAARGDARAAVDAWNRLAVLEPHSGRVALGYMRALEAAGDRAAAIQHARVHQAMVREEFGAEPDAEVLALAERLRSAPAQLPRAEAPRAASPPSPPRPAEIETLSSAQSAEAPASASTSGASVAVLPFASIASEPDPRDAYFRDGLTDELIDALAKVKGLRVIARTSAFAVGSGAPAEEIAGRLAVEHLLEGSVRRAADHLRISVRLLRVRDHTVVWSETYDGAMGDVFRLQNLIARQVATALEVWLAGGTPPPAARRPTADLEAYDLYLHGRHAWHARTPAGFTTALSLFERAAQRDPAYAQAHVGVADVHNMMGAFDYGVLAPADAFPRARAAAEAALRIDPGLAEAHAALGVALFNYHWEWLGAERAFGRAMALNPGYADAHHWYASLLAATGRRDESVAESRAARVLDPLSAAIGTGLGRNLYFAREFDAAAAEYERTLQAHPASVHAPVGLGMVALQTGRLERAAACFEQARALARGEHAAPAAMLGHAWGLLGRRPQALDLLSRIERDGEGRYLPPEYAAVVHLGCGDSAAALDHLERAYELRSGLMAYLAVEPLFDPLRGHPRFTRLLERIGLPIPLPEHPPAQRAPAVSAA
jgi:TolB-like protein/DNA-binding SARP family transcriptional activator